MPVLLVVGALSVPITGVLFVYFKFTEWRFVREMQSLRRVMDWPALLRSLEAKNGTMIEEWLSEKGPVRRWWTPDNVAAISPHGFPDSGVEGVFDRQFDHFCSWCYENYTNGVTGKALFLASSYVRKSWDRTEELLHGGDIKVIPSAATQRQRTAWAKP
jgi:hypothetical protein